MSSTPHTPVDTLPSDGGIPTPFKSETARPWPEYMDEDDTQPDWQPNWEGRGLVTIEVRPAGPEASLPWYLPWDLAVEPLKRDSCQVIYLDAHRPNRASDD